VTYGGRIPLLAEERWRDSLIEAGAPGAKREPARSASAKARSLKRKGEASISGHFGEKLRRSDHYYGFALSRSRFAPGCAASVASRHSFDGAATPPLRGGEYARPAIFYRAFPTWAEKRCGDTASALSNLEGTSFWLPRRKPKSG